MNWDIKVDIVDTCNSSYNSTDHSEYIRDCRPFPNGKDQIEQVTSK